jgi:quinol monooxygenase YgiN
MVISTLTLVPAPKRHPEVLEILRSVVGPTAIQPGCLTCRVSEESGPDHAVVFRAHWKNSAALREHILSDLYSNLLAACELSSQPPEFRFHHVSRTQGMDLIEQLRDRGGEALPISTKK